MDGRGVTLMAFLGFVPWSGMVGTPRCGLLWGKIEICVVMPRPYRRAFTPVSESILSNCVLPVRPVCGGSGSCEQMLQAGQWKMRFGCGCAVGRGVLSGGQTHLQSLCRV